MTDFRKPGTGFWDAVGLMVLDDEGDLRMEFIIAAILLITVFALAIILASGKGASAAALTVEKPAEVEAEHVTGWVYRLRAPGGWVYKDGNGMCFVPDPAPTGSLK